jgi:hypothetical protein
LIADKKQLGERVEELIVKLKARDSEFERA